MTIKTTPEELIKEFLETYPLYRKLRYQETRIGPELDPAIHWYCRRCGDLTTFTGTEYIRTERGHDYSSTAKEIAYDCAACNRRGPVFFLQVKSPNMRDYTPRSAAGDNAPMPVEVWKVGQIPPWAPPIGKRLEKVLGPERSLFFKKGMANEGLSNGIGAFAYYRRVVEEVIDDLLGSIEDLLDGPQKAAYRAALEETKKSTVAAEKIDLVKDLLPPVLRPDGINPLANVHAALSEGLHALPEEECLELAEDVRTSLEFLVEQVHQHGQSKRKFTDAQRRLLERKSARGARKSEDGKE